MSTPSKKALEIFEEAQEIESLQARHDFLQSQCGDDQELLSEVERLFRVFDKLDGFLDDAQAITVGGDIPAMEQPGDVIGQFELIEEIGEGGFGVVYIAKERSVVERRVALKILKPGMDTREIVLRFERERQLLASLDHPNIAKLFNGGTTRSGRPYFVMEYVDGLPLTEYCDKHRLTVRERLDLFVGICRAVHHAHEKGIIHRDLKPFNILVAEHDGAPFPKVIDFGVAKVVSHQHALRTLYTRSDQLIGTPRYMSPEQAMLEELEIDRRSDVYSLGTILFELLTGTTPLEAESLRGAGFDEICRRIRMDDTPTPSHRLGELEETVVDVAAARRTDPKGLRTCLRGEVDWIVLKALEKERSRRYETAGQLADDIEAHFNNEPLLASRPSITYRVGKFLSRHRRWQAPLAALFLLLLAGLAWRALLSRAERPWQPPDMSSGFTPQHAWIEPCHFVLLAETGAEIDIRAAEKAVQSSIQSLFTTDTLSFDPSRRAAVVPTIHVSGGWLLWEVPISARWDEWTKRDNSAIGPPDVSVKIRLAVSKNGTIQIGVLDGTLEEQLLLLTKQTGFSNYKTFGNSYVELEDFKEPHDDLLDLCAQQTALGAWFAEVYRHMALSGVAHKGPKDYSELYRCPLEIRNHTGEPVTVILGRIFHQKYVYTEYFAIEELVRRPANFRWSPLPEKVWEGIIESRLVVDFDYDSLAKSDARSALNVRTGADRRNGSAFRVTGLTFDPSDYIRIDADPNADETSMIDYDPSKGVCVASHRPVGGSFAYLYNQFPSQIELRATSRWSTVNPVFRYVIAGEVPKTSAHVSAVVQETDDQYWELLPRPMELQIWTIPPYQAPAK